jgi:hypothetical protein
MRSDQRLVAFGPEKAFFDQILNNWQIRSSQQTNKHELNGERRNEGLSAPRERRRYLLATIAQNLRRLGKFVARPPPQATACVAVSVACVGECVAVPLAAHGKQQALTPRLALRTLPITDFCNKIDTIATWKAGGANFRLGSEADVDGA